MSYRQFDRAELKEEATGFEEEEAGEGVEAEEAIGEVPVIKDMVENFSEREKRVW